MFVTLCISQGGKIDYGTSKVKSGSGPEVISALSYLAGEALKATHVEWDEYVQILK